MDLVVDANVLFSFFSKEAFTRSFIVKASMHGNRLYTPEYCIEELETDKEKIKQFSKLDDKEFSLALSAIDSFVKTVKATEYQPIPAEAEELAPHAKDVPYFALALKLDCGIWSNEKAFKGQTRVKVYNTGELKSMVP